jgi:hypothetical protein
VFYPQVVLEKQPSESVHGALVNSKDIPRDTGGRKTLFWTAFFSLGLLAVCSFVKNPFNQKPAIVLSLTSPGFELRSWIVESDELPVPIQLVPIEIIEKNRQELRPTAPNSIQLNTLKAESRDKALKRSQTCARYKRRKSTLSQLAQVVGKSERNTQRLELPCLNRESDSQRCTHFVLDEYWSKLEKRLVDGEVIALRWSQFGDSLVARDHWSEEFRNILQPQFGDGGHGFLTTGRPPNGYGTGKYSVNSDGWQPRIMRPWGPYPFGPAGITFQSLKDSQTRIKARVKSALFDRIGILYEADERASILKYKVHDKWHSLKLRPGDGPQIEWVSLSKPVDNFTLVWQKAGYFVHGLYLQNRGAGFTVDNFGMVSGQPTELAK